LRGIYGGSFIFSGFGLAATPGTAGQGHQSRPNRHIFQELSPGSTAVTNRVIEEQTRLGAKRGGQGVV
jgi:hypothetical protein